MCMAVNFVRHIATGTFTRQTKQLSNRNVIIVFPPLLKMKYSEFDSDINGVAAAIAHINLWQVGVFRRLYYRNMEIQVQVGQEL